MRPIGVFIVEDDPMVLELHQRFISTIAGFTVVGSAKDGQSALEGIIKTKPNLVILDMFMPEMDGLEVLKRMRELRMPSDVIMVTAAHEAATVKESLRLGAVDYLIKPFRFDRLKEALKSYERRFRQFGNSVVKQEDIDILLRRRGGTEADLPKGIQSVTLSRILSILAEYIRKPLSAEEVAQLAGVSRITARRYLEYLASKKEVQIEPDYGSVGRPLNRYLLKKSPDQNDQNDH